jgi:hypothetical protein|tara:strand:- start:4893 stop:5072 length:180 start_codon:yes stop_codon:yes gene_type:complete
MAFETGKLTKLGRRGAGRVTGRRCAHVDSLHLNKRVRWCEMSVDGSVAGSSRTSERGKL